MQKRLPVKFFMAIYFVMAFPATNIAQITVTVSGVIYDSETSQPLIYANVAITELGIGSMTDVNGKFTLHSLPEGNYTLFVRYIGYSQYSSSIHLSGDTLLNIYLQKQSLALEEVTVTAENSRSTTTSYTINNQAISHIQATSIREIIQLIPGNISENPNLAIPGKMSIRETDTDVNSALGAAFFIDGIPVSNDGNLQESIGLLNDMTSVAGTGIDLRSIPVENIESITVDVGISSAEHGNLTSGAVHIKTKTGRSEYSLKLQADPHTKQAYLGKGYLLKKEMGVINFDMGYTQSYRHLVKQTDLYKRINATAKYSNTFLKAGSPLNLNLKIYLMNSLDGQKWDPDMILEEENYSKDRALSASFTTTWLLNKSFITNLDFDFGFEKTWQSGFEKTWEQSTTGPNFFTTATEEGEYEISYGPSGYYSEVTYDGKPFNIYSKLKANLLKKIGSLAHNLLLGTEWRTTGNNGEGRIFDLERPPSGVGTRPRPFSDIPSLNQFSLFLEDKILVEFGYNNLNLMAGLRMDNIQPDGLFQTKGSISFDPRINAEFQILNDKNNAVFDAINIRAGFGKTTKAPTLYHLYPDKKYNDIESFNYYPDLIVYTTNVVEDTRNYNLKPATGKKYETGLDFKIEKTEGRITLFHERFTNGFTLDQIYYPVHYRDYITIATNLHPFYVPGDGIYYQDDTSGETIPVEYENDVKFVNYSLYRNADIRIKKGLEYNITTGTIEIFRTSFNLSGAWFYTESFSNKAPYWVRQEYTEFNGNSISQESFAVKFSDRHGFGTISERFNTNFRIINHIPELRMLISLNAQIIWFEKNRRKLYPEKHKLYTLTELRNHLGTGDLFAYENKDEFYYYLPESYKFYDNIEHEYTENDFDEPLHQMAIEKMAKFRFNEEVYPVLFKCDIKISKDIGDRFSLSFYANNFLNIRPWYQTKREGWYVRRNQAPYFGADIKMQF